jgi:hypothetical protein
VEVLIRVSTPGSDSSIYGAICRIGGNNEIGDELVAEDPGWLDLTQAVALAARGRRSPIGCASATHWTLEVVAIQSIATARAGF